MEAAVAMSESKNDEAPRSFINHVTVTSWAETNVPDKTLASHKRRNTGFRSANHVDIDFLSIPESKSRLALHAFRRGS
jgi:hypothetical protein